MKSFHANILLFMLFLFLVLFWLQLVTGVNKIDDTATVKLSGAKKKSNKKKKVNSGSQDDSEAKNHILKTILEKLKSQDNTSENDNISTEEKSPYQDINYSHLAVGRHGTENMNLSDILAQYEKNNSENDRNKIHLTLEDFQGMLNPNIT